MSKTTIAWTEETNNIWRGCTRESEGCDNCYITSTFPFRMEKIQWNGEGVGSTTGVRFFPQRIPQLMAGLTPRRRFLNSLSDTWHAHAGRDLIARTFAAMVLAPQHNFQFPTKRPRRQRRVLSSPDFWEAVLEHAKDLAPLSPAYRKGLVDIPDSLSEVPAHIWVGVSVENQKAADLRIPELQRTPAATRWLSCEPLIGPLNLDGMLRGIDWVVLGGESGSRARRMDPRWAIDVWRQCEEAGVPFFFKQAGRILAGEWGCKDSKGENPAEWPVEFTRQYPLDLMAVS